MLTITNKIILRECEKLGIKFEIISEKHNLIILQFAGRKNIIRRSRIPQTSSVFPYIAEKKSATYEILDFFRFPFPKFFLCADEKNLEKIAKKLNFPLITKPENGEHGDGIVMNIKNLTDLKKAFLKTKNAKKGNVIVQEFFAGDDHRILIVGGKFVAAAKRTPAKICGDGKLTIEKLIEKENKNSRRGENYNSPLTKIKIDDEMKNFLAQKNLNLQKIPRKNEKIFLRKVANLSQGGESEDCTEKIPRENILLFEKIAQNLQANVVGIDILTKNISAILTPKNYKIIEVNESPGIRMHHFPSVGKPRNVAKKILQEIFPELKK